MEASSKNMDAALKVSNRMLLILKANSPLEKYPLEIGPVVGKDTCTQAHTHTRERTVYTGNFHTGKSYNNDAIQQIYYNDSYQQIVTKTHHGQSPGPGKV